MWKKLSAGAFAFVFVLGSSITPTFAKVSVDSTNQAVTEASRRVVYVGNWDIKYGNDYEFTEGANLVGNVVFDGRKLTFQFQKPGYVTLKVWDDGGVSIYSYSVK